MNIIVNNFQDKWKGSVIPMWRFSRPANWNATTCYWLGQRISKDGENNSAYLCLIIANNSIFKSIMQYFLKTDQ